MKVVTLSKGHYALGSFATARQAAEAYDLAALILHGEFAQMNVVQ